MILFLKKGYNPILIVMFGMNMSLLTKGYICKLSGNSEVWWKLLFALLISMLGHSASWETNKQNKRRKLRKKKKK